MFFIKEFGQVIYTGSYIGQLHRVSLIWAKAGDNFLLFADIFINTVLIHILFCPGIGRQWLNGIVFCLELPYWAKIH